MHSVIHQDAGGEWPFQQNLGDGGGGSYELFHRCLTESVDRPDPSLRERKACGDSPQDAGGE
jgi:hypothetical protein